MPYCRFDLALAETWQSLIAFKPGHLIKPRPELQHEPFAALQAFNHIASGLRLLSENALTQALSAVW